MLLICGMQLILLSSGSSYVRPGPAARALGMVGVNGIKWPVFVPPGCVARDKLLAVEV